MVARAVAYLEKTPLHGRLGGECLYALTLDKASGSSEHARIQRAAKRCENLVASGEYRIDDLDNYSLALAVMLLCEIEPVLHREATVTLVNELLRRQSPEGAWTYPGSKAGDTSQSQYAVLALWAADHAGIEIPDGPLVRVANWLLRTQTPNGGWGYHPSDPGAFQRRDQKDVRHSMTAAGLGSLYVCANVMDLPSVTGPRTKTSRGPVPSVLVPVGRKSGSDSAFTRTGVAPTLLHDAQRDGILWLDANAVVAPEKFALYYLYGLERYHSFREYAEGIAPDQCPWYDQGVEWLAATQAENGSWPNGGTQPGPDTAFAILFLIRSTRQSLGLPTEGVLRGGIGLPGNDDDVNLQGARLVARESDRRLRAALELLRDDESGSAENTASSAGEEMEKIAAQGDVARLARLARHGDAGQRLAAIRILSAARHLDAAPALIAAIDDDDPRVVLAARDGLRFLSRKLQGFGLEPPLDAQQRRQARARWQRWYQLVRPEAEFWDEASENP